MCVYSNSFQAVVAEQTCVEVQAATCGLSTPVCCLPAVSEALAITSDEEGDYEQRDEILMRRMQHSFGSECKLDCTRTSLMKDELKHEPDTLASVGGISLQPLGSGQSPELCDVTGEMVTLRRPISVEE